MEDNQGHDPDMLPPDLEALIFGGDTPAPDVEEEVREGEVVPPKSAPVSDVSAVRTQVIPDIDELPEDATEVLRVYRDLNDGKLIFEMKGKLFAASQHIEDSPLANRFSAIVDEMVKIDAGLRRRPATSQVPPPPQRPVPPPPSQSRAPVDEDAPEPTIGDQIQDFLQHRLAAHPEFAGRRINIRPSLHGSITIEVDGHFYDAVADIPDASVRDFLQQTIQDWSDRH